MKREYIMTSLLSLSIVFIATGVHINNLIIVAIGGLFCGVYNGMLFKKIE